MKRLFLAALIGACTLGLRAAAQPTVTVRVDGDGYLRFVRDGKMVYAKTAKLTIADGRISHSSGPKLVPAISVPGAKALSVDLEGHVFADGQPVGQIVLALFSTNLVSMDKDGLAGSSLRPSLGNPGDGPNGVIRTGTIGSVSPKTRPPIPESTKAETAPDVEGLSGTGSANDHPKTSTSLNSGKPTQQREAPTTGIQIKFPDRIEVDTDTFSLGQIATISGVPSGQEHLSQIEMGDTPPLGIDRIVDRNRISFRLKAAGIDPNTVSLIGPDKIHVTRKGQSIAHGQFVACAISGAQAKGAGATFEAMTPGPEMTVPIGKVELVCESVSSTAQETNALIGVYVDGKRFNSRSVKLRSTGAVSTLKVGTVVSVKVVSKNVSVTSKGKVVKVDQSTGQVTVQMTDTGAQLVGIVTADGTVEVKA